MLDGFWQDLRFALRSLRKRPLFFLVLVSSLAVGIGANTAIFSAVNRLLLRGLAGVPNASRMVEVGRGRDGHGFGSFSYPDFLDLREQADPFRELAGTTMQMLTFSRGDAGERAFGMLVSANFFDLLGVTAARGRTFLPEEDEGADEHPVVVVSHQFWTNRLGEDADILGSTVFVSRKPYTVVGIAPESFRGPVVIGNPDLYIPLMQYPSLNESRNQFERRGSSWFQVFGLLNPESTLEEADASVATIFRRLAEEYPETNRDRTGAVRPYGALPAEARGPVGIFLALLMAMVVLILLITCANVAGMFLARATGRRKEIAIRLSTGSGRGQLIRHLLTEYLLVFFLGGVGGVVLALVGLRFIMALELPAPFPVEIRMGPDGGVFLFAAAVTLLTGLVFGLLPARQALNLDLVSTLKDEGARAGSSDTMIRRGFVSAQVGASLVLLVAASLLLRTLHQAGKIETGFQPEGAYLAFLDLSAEGYAEAEGAVFLKEVVDHFSGLPWVESVSLSADLPLDLSSSSTSVEPEGWAETPEEGYFSVGYNSVTPDYFRTLGIPILEGRAFSGGDIRGSDPVAVVSRTFVERAWPGESALGRRVGWGGRESENLTIVGVVEDVQNQMLSDAPEPFLYRPHAQFYQSGNNLVIRSDSDRGLVFREIHEGLRTLDPNISLSPVIDLQSYTAVGILPQRIAGILATALGCLALLLSGMGIYGVVAFSVASRTRETGIRIALGAEPDRVLKSVLVGAFRLVLPGLVLGAVLAVGVGFILRSLLLGVSPADPLALLSVLVALSIMVLAGSFFPARRASRIHPAEALRHD